MNDAVLVDGEYYRDLLVAPPISEQSDLHTIGTQVSFRINRILVSQLTMCKLNYTDMYMSYKLTSKRLSAYNIPDYNYSVFQIYILVLFTVTCTFST